LAGGPTGIAFGGLRLPGIRSEFGGDPTQRFWVCWAIGAGAGRAGWWDEDPDSILRKAAPKPAGAAAVDPARAFAGG
jgi:hypothetical protein